MTLTHTNTNDWADSAGSFCHLRVRPEEDAVHGGLTDFGRQVVLEMNRLGMLVDVSHVSDKTIADVLDVSRRRRSSPRIPPAGRSPTCRAT